MNYLNIIIPFVGGLGMFIYGMQIMAQGLENAAGNKMKSLLEVLTKNKLMGVLLGAAITAVIQSSSATTVMVVGFVNAGIMNLTQAMGVIMGANVGTTVTGWLVSSVEWAKFLSPATLAPIAVMLGVIIMLTGKRRSSKEIASIVVGFGLLFIGITTMSSAVAPLQESEGFRSIFVTLGNNPLLGILAGALVTAIIQSSSASVGILQSLAAAGLVPFSAAIYIIMGQNIGTCVTAMISAVGANRGAKRTAFVHLYFNVIGTILFLVLFYTGNALIGFEFTNEVVGAAGIAMIHTIFNVFATLVLLPFTKGLEKLAYLTIPKTAEEQNQKEDVFVILDDRFLNSPAFAIEQCHSLANQMAKITHEGFLEAMTVLDEYSEEKIEDVIAKENIVDTYDDKLSAYLTRLSSQNLSYKDSLKVTSLLHCLTDFERISDHSINVVENAQQMVKEGAVFSKKAKEEMLVYSAALRDILERTTNAFVEGDEALARTVEPLEEVIDELNKKVKKNHMKRLRKGKCTIELGLVLSDLAMNYERVADHCSNIAVYMMQLEDTQLEEHSFTEQMDAEESAEFTKQLNEFEKMYQI